MLTVEHISIDSVVPFIIALLSATLIGIMGIPLCRLAYYGEYGATSQSRYMTRCIFGAVFLLHLAEGSKVGLFGLYHFPIGSFSMMYDIIIEGQEVAAGF
jgi:hypothetical protein